MNFPAPTELLNLADELETALRYEVDSNAYRSLMKRASTALRQAASDNSDSPALAVPSTNSSAHRGTLEDAAQRLSDELLAQHISRDKFAIGVGSGQLYAYVQLARVNCRADVIDGWPVVWHFNVGPRSSRG